MNTITTKTTAQMTWMVDYSAEPVNEVTEHDRTRSCDGKWLKRNCKLNSKPVRRFLDGDDDSAR